MTEPFPDTLGRRIMSARMRRGVKQAELARAIGISANSLVKIEKGVTANPGALIVRDIARALRVSTDYLLGLSDDIEGAAAPTAMLA